MACTIRTLGEAEFRLRARGKLGIEGLDRSSVDDCVSPSGSEWPVSKRSHNRTMKPADRGRSDKRPKSPQRLSGHVERPRAFECLLPPNQTSKQPAAAGDQVFDEPEAVHEHHRVPIALAREDGFGSLAGRDIGREDVHLGRRPRAETLGSQGGEGGVGTLDLVGRAVVGVRDVPLAPVHHPRDNRLGELERRRNRRPTLVDRGVNRHFLDVGVVDGQLLVDPFGEDEGDVVPASESPNSLVPAVRRLSHRDEQAAVGDVEPAHASLAVAPSSAPNSSSPAPASSMS